MTFYQELQLSSTGSKQLIRSTTDPKEKRRHILIYNFKVYLVMAFCVAVVSMYSKLTGSSNSVVGVTVLLAVLVRRQADRYSYGRTPSGKYSASVSRVCSECCVYFTADDTGLS